MNAEERLPMTALAACKPFLHLHSSLHSHATVEMCLLPRLHNSVTVGRASAVSMYASVIGPAAGEQSLHLHLRLHSVITVTEVRHKETLPMIVHRCSRYGMVPRTTCTASAAV